MAASLSAIVVALLLSGVEVFRRETVRRNASSTSTRRKQTFALRQLADELECAMDPGDGAPPFVLQREPSGPRLRWTTARSLPELSGAQGSIRLELSGAHGQAVRTVLDDTAPVQATGPASVLASGLRALEIEVFDGRSWTDAWPGETGAPFPAAVRIRLVPRAGSSLVVETVLPAGEIWEPGGVPPF